MPRSKLRLLGAGAAGVASVCVMWALKNRFENSISEAIDVLFCRGTYINRRHFSGDLLIVGKEEMEKLKDYSGEALDVVGSSDKNHQLVRHNSLHHLEVETVAAPKVEVLNRQKLKVKVENQHEGYAVKVGGWGRMDMVEGRPLSQWIETDAKDYTDIEVEWQTEWEEVKHGKRRSTWARNGKFVCPPARRIPVPKEVTVAYFRFVSAYPPSSTMFKEKKMPVCLCMAASGQEFFEEREASIATPLALKHKVSTIVMEQPYYGLRRPLAKQMGVQVGAEIATFAELNLMAGLAIMECAALATWVKKQGYEKICVTGTSMGGCLVAWVASLLPFECGAVPVLPSHSASCVWTEAALSKVCNWDNLARLAPELGTKEKVIEKARSILQSTDIRTSAIPMAPHACIVLAAERDGYIPAYSAQLLKDHWGDKAEMRWFPGGHVTFFVFRQHHTVQAIVDSLARL